MVEYILVPPQIHHKTHITATPLTTIRIPRIKISYNLFTRLMLIMYITFHHKVQIIVLHHDQNKVTWSNKVFTFSAVISCYLCHLELK